MHKYLIKIKDSCGIIHEKEMNTLTINEAVHMFALELQEEDPDIVFIKIDFEIL
jgi:hypothetical protein